MSLSVLHNVKERVGWIHLQQPHRAAQAHTHKIDQHVPQGGHRHLASNLYTLLSCESRLLYA